jgi:uncharacterized protein (TIGR02266 family)
MMQDPVPNERRSTTRHHLEAEVSFESESNVFTGIVRDVSRGGVFIATYAPLPVGTHVVLDLILPDARVEVRGAVRWRRELSDEASPGMGIEFEKLDPQALSSIEAFCSRREPLYIDIDD